MRSRAFNFQKKTNTKRMLTVTCIQVSEKKKLATQDLELVSVKLKTNAPMAANRTLKLHDFHRVIL